MYRDTYFIIGFTTGVVVSSYLFALLYVQTRKPSRTNGHASTHDRVQTVAEKLGQQFNVSTKTLQSLTMHLVQEYRKGLAYPNQTLKMLPSFVTKMPQGTEVATVLALDMGGSNFRVLLVHFEGAGRIRTKQRKFTLTDDLKCVQGVDLFDFFAECIAGFLKDEGLPTGPHKLGFTFSFPVLQKSINSGTLITWAKGFANNGVIDRDVVELLSDALKRKSLDIKVSALVNDTVGTLVTHAYKDPQTYVGVILGTGTNAAYVEKAANVAKWPLDSGDIIINTEWGAYNDLSVLPLNKYDKMLDRASQNPKQQVFEKMISGMYLGELCRLTMCDLVSSGDLFKALMSRIERDHTLDLNDIQSVLEEFMQIPTTSFNDRRIVKHVCEVIGTRSARLSASGIASLVTKINKLDACTVAIDGSLFEHYPHYGNRMRDALRELLGITAENLVLEQARDGSGQGAALIAALH